MRNDDVCSAWEGKEESEKPVERKRERWPGNPLQQRECVCTMPPLSIGQKVEAALMVVVNANEDLRDLTRSFEQSI